MEEEDRWTWAREELRDGCVEIYHRERAKGAELPTIIGMLREHVENEEKRLRDEQEERWRQTREEERQRREGRLLSGADCGWTLPNSPNWLCRTNGRAYRLSPTKDRMWDLARVESVADHEPGRWIGKYRYRRDATKIVARIAYEPEPI